MKKAKTTLIIVITLTLLTTTLVTGYTFHTRSIHYVDDDGGADFTKIQDAIDYALTGDTIYVYPGTYYENIVINKDGLTILGENKYTTIINGNNTGHCVTILDYENTIISGFTVENANGDGFRLGAGWNKKTRFNQIINCIVCNNTAYGINIYAYGSSGYAEHNIVQDCTVYGSGIDGIQISAHKSGSTGLYARYNQIINTESHNNTGYGIHIYGNNDMRYTTIANCTSQFNQLGGIRVNGGNVNFITIINTTISSNNGTGLWSESGGEIIQNLLCTKNNGDGILSTGTPDTFINLTITNNTGHGLYTIADNSIYQNINSHHNTNNNIFITGTNNHYHNLTTYNSQAGGMLLKGNNPTITNTISYSNQNYGCRIEYATTPNLRNAKFYNNSDGLQLDTCTNGIFTNLQITQNQQNIQPLSSGLLIDTSSNLLIYNSTISHNHNGITLIGSSTSNQINTTRITHHTNYGIYTQFSNTNLFYNNYIHNNNNSYEFTSTPGNTWNISLTNATNIIQGPYIGGNYWSDYNGTDLNLDGIGDTPYPIPGGTSIDTYPLVYLGDHHPPTITNITTTPPTNHIGGHINISCTITDDTQVDTANIIITTPTGTTTNHTMNHHQTYSYNTTHTIPGTYTFHIWANDTNHNHKTSPTHTFTIQNYPPHQPNNPIPAHQAYNIPVINLHLQWTGGDPDTTDLIDYHIYLDTTNANTPLGFLEDIPSYQTSITYTLPISLQYQTTYYWKIKATDSTSSTTTSQIWSFTTQATPQPDLTATGSIQFTKIKPGSTQTAWFTIQNIGQPQSNLHWEINEYPTWGTWTFTPNQGTNLTPKNGPQLIGVTITVPNQQHQTYEGEIKIINQDDPSDYATIPITITTANQIKSIKHPLLKN